ncbi:hypothetical protein AX766_04795 [Flavobacterium covae]|nr:hypothetical protein AWN65_00655 [Flavobacterium covae]AND63781.1 hypothetical protein AX766_04795 [Flavobacterium covae]OWP80076.1 hypothetical protein BWK63_12965 [Flavobacterium covae]POR20647.1 hypothetical protein BWK57_12875 [Flavobacterium columnare]
MEYKSIIKMFFLMAIINSCKSEKRKCDNAELNNEIIIKDWGENKIKKEDIKLYKYDSLFSKKIDSFKIVKFSTYNDKKTIKEYYGSMSIILDKEIVSKGNYRLILLDSLKYDISNIRILTKTVMIGTREENMCLIESYKINNRVSKLGSGGVQIILKKDYKQ